MKIGSFLRLLGAMYLFFGASLLVAQSDPKADKILKTSKSQFSIFKDVSVSFKKTLFKSKSDNQGSTMAGTMKLKKEKFRIDLSDQVIACNGKTLWNYMKTEKEVVISNYDPQEGMSPERILMLAQNDMKSRYEQAEVVANVNTDKISLFPNSKDHEFHRVEIWIDTQKSIPRRIKMYNRTGTIVVYDITNVTTDTNISDASFALDVEALKKSNVEVVDNR